MSPMYKIVGAIVAVSISMAGRIAMMQCLKPPAMPPIPIAMPTGTTPPGGGPLPQFQPMVLPFPTTGQPGFSFPSPSTILGSGPAPAPARSNVRRKAARSGAGTPYSPAKSLRGAVRAAPGPAARTAESGGKPQAATGR